MGKAYIAFLWHMHQPYYINPFTLEYYLPWVFLHGTKDYYDMPDVVEKIDGAKVTFNLVPSLIRQIEDYTSKRLNDRYVKLIEKDVKDLKPFEKNFILKYFFPFSDENLKSLSPYYYFLKQKANLALLHKNGKIHFEDQEFLDIEVLFLLCWCGKELKRNEFISKLWNKGKGYTHEEKIKLLHLMLEFMKKIIPKYQKLVDDGTIEVTVSPYSHPILPLIYDIRNAKRANPATQMPEELFSYPDDVKFHLYHAKKLCENYFKNKEICGMWPSEGSVSPDIIPLIKESGFNYLVTDRAILEKSLGRKTEIDEVFVPYKYNDVFIFFRDTKLSDLIGFTYFNWDTEKAASDFVKRLEYSLNVSRFENPIIPIAMDGENAWEHYTNCGYEFLEVLYKKIADHPDFEFITFKEYLKKFPQNVKNLDNLGTGSWIYGNFNTWIGDDSKNRAWSHLAKTRHEVRNFLEEYDLVKFDQVKDLPIVEYIMRCEASDWFWWYGFGHSSLNDIDFDFLFRQNLKFLYKLIGINHPLELDRPIEHEISHFSLIEPFHFISPNISGYKDDYFEWLDAGSYELSESQTIKLNPRIKKAFFGFNKENIFLRVDFFGKAEEILSGVKLKLTVIQPKEFEYTFDLNKNSDSSDLVEWKASEILEVKLPLSLFYPQEMISKGIKDIFAFNLKIIKRGMAVERFPWNIDIEFTINTVDIEIENWTV